MTNNELLREVEARRSLPSPALRRAIRTDAGVSIARIASTLGVSDVTVLRWERGDNEPRPDKLIAYHELLAELREAST